MQSHHATGTSGINSARRAFEIEDVRDSVREDSNPGANHVRLRDSSGVLVSHALEAVKIRSALVVDMK